MSDFGDLIASIRWSNACDAGHSGCREHMTQACLADRIGFHQMQISRVETGRPITYAMAGIICDYLGLGMGEFHGDSAISKGVDPSLVRPVIPGIGSLADYKDMILRFGSDAKKARQSMTCHDRCCRDYLSAVHCGVQFGIGANNWRNLESGRMVVRLEMFLLVCKYFKMNPLNYVGTGTAVGSGAGDALAVAIDFIAARSGRISFLDNGDDGQVLVMVPGVKPRWGDSIVESVAWLKRDLEQLQVALAKQIQRRHVEQVA